MATNARKTGWLTDAVAAEIRALMGREDWSQRDLSRATGIPQPTISSVLSAKTAFDLEQLDAIARALGSTPDRIMRAADTRDANALNEVYTPDGGLDPTNTRGLPPADEHLNDLEACRRADGE